jgi:Amt family ammonium transporter
VIGAVTTFLYSAIISVVILFVINKVIGLRVDAEQEQIGLDLAQHGEHVP